jgi:CYTH domain-containing protein
MSVEIERKFLVSEKDFNSMVPFSGALKQSIVQGYLNSSPDSTVRIRTSNEKGFLTVKGKQEGLSKEEIECEIDYKIAKELIEKFCPSVVWKTRYSILQNNKVWEIDVFHGKNKGLIVAEVKLKSEDEEIIIPVWAKKEVTGNHKYSCSRLVKNDRPFQT